MNRRLGSSLMAAKFLHSLSGLHIYPSRTGSNRQMPTPTTQTPMLLQRANTLVRGSGAQTAIIPSTPSWSRCWSCFQSSTRRLCACLPQWPAARWLLVMPLCRALCLTHFLVSIPGAFWALHWPPDIQLSDAATLCRAHIPDSSHEEQLESQQNQHHNKFISHQAAMLLGPAGLSGVLMQDWTETNAVSAASALKTSVAETGQMGCRVAAVTAGEASLLAVSHGSLVHSCGCLLP